MSNSKKTGAYNPTNTALLTIEQMQEMVVFFKRVFEDSPLAWWIKLAGIGAALEGAHIIWLLLKYLKIF